MDPLTAADEESALVPGADPATRAARWAIAEAITDQVCRRYPADVLAVGVRGSLAHGDERDGSDVEIVVVTYRPDSGPMPTSRRIDGFLVDVDVVSAAEYLAHARTLTTRWPLTADQYLHTKPLRDDTSWYPRLRDTHLARLAEAGGREFAALARAAWCTAESLHRKAVRCSEWFDTNGALLVLGEARTATALTEGLLTRTYFRSSADAGRRTGLSGADIAEVGSKLAEQAAELAKRAKPVDGTVTDLFR